jgi:hypothetical protein
MALVRVASIVQVVDDEDGFYYCLSKRTPLLNGLWL